MVNINRTMATLRPAPQEARATRAKRLRQRINHRHQVRVVQLTLPPRKQAIILRPEERNLNIRLRIRTRTARRSTDSIILRRGKVSIRNRAIRLILRNPACRVRRNRMGTKVERVSRTVKASSTLPRAPITRPASRTATGSNMAGLLLHHHHPVSRATNIQRGTNKTGHRTAHRGSRTEVKRRT